MVGLHIDGRPGRFEERHVAAAEEHGKHDEQLRAREVHADAHAGPARKGDEVLGEGLAVEGDRGPVAREPALGAELVRRLPDGRVLVRVVRRHAKVGARRDHAVAVAHGRRRRLADRPRRDPDRHPQDLVYHAPEVR